ncbi:MAG TPA: hypothetical protein HA263_05785 [Methanoregulaceae archaeon]|nr:hypothetical protein [Methanoregulaceae archaeon]
MEAHRSRLPGNRPAIWIAAALCAAVAAAAAVEQSVPDRPAYAEAFAPDWLPLAAAGLALAGIALRLRARPRWPHLQGALSWSGLLLMVWAAGGLPIDLLRVAGLVVPGLMPSGVDWPGLATRAVALAAAVVLAGLALERPAARSHSGAAAWYGYVALALALPYPVFKTWWALGGTVGLRWPGADGLAGSLALWLPAVPWLLAAAVSLLLVSTPRWMPRRLLLAAGWSAAAIVAVVGPAACWSLVSGLIGGDSDFGGMAGWVFGLFYSCWFLWAIAAAAATWSYQVRSAA